MRRVAIFDVDGTIFRSSLLIELVEELVRDGIFPQQAVKHYMGAWSDWRNREGTYEEYIGRVIETFERHIKGVSFTDFERVSERVVESRKKHTYRYTRDLIDDLRSQGYYLLAISQSPKGILDKFCAELGFDKVYGRFYELGPEDKFTGQTLDLHLIANKANIVRRALEKEGLTLDGSVGVGDTEGDIPMLELVDTAICFNPNMSLYREAKRNGWKIVVERKDVVYTIS